MRQINARSPAIDGKSTNPFVLAAYACLFDVQSLAQVDDIVAARKEMEAQGIEFLGPIEGEADDYKWTHFRAPDGFVYELTYSAAHPSIAE